MVGRNKLQVGVSLGLHGQKRAMGITKGLVIRVLLYESLGAILRKIKALLQLLV